MIDSVKYLIPLAVWALFFASEAQADLSVEKRCIIAKALANAQHAQCLARVEILEVVQDLSEDEASLLKAGCDAKWSKRIARAKSRAEAMGGTCPISVNPDMLCVVCIFELGSQFGVKLQKGIVSTDLLIPKSTFIILRDGFETPLCKDL